MLNFHKQTAVDDLEEIILYIASDSKKQALEWYNALINKTNRFIYV
jgi:plasmid stabilization system protein ParE